MGVSLKCACALQLLVTMETYLLIFCACANHVALLFINKVGESRRGLSIRLSGIFSYPACFWNQGVRIIEVLLYWIIYIVNSRHPTYLQLKWSGTRNNGTGSLNRKLELWLACFSGRLLGPTPGVILLWDSKLLCCDPQCIYLCTTKTQHLFYCSWVAVHARQLSHTSLHALH